MHPRPLRAACFSPGCAPPPPSGSPPPPSPVGLVCGRVCVDDAAAGVAVEHVGATLAHAAGRVCSGGGWVGSGRTAGHGFGSSTPRTRGWHAGQTRVPAPLLPGRPSAGHGRAPSITVAPPTHPRVHTASGWAALGARLPGNLRADRLPAAPHAPGRRLPRHQRAAAALGGGADAANRARLGGVGPVPPVHPHPWLQHHALAGTPALQGAEGGWTRLARV